MKQLEGLNSTVSTSNDFVLNKKNTLFLNFGAQYTFKSYSGVTTTNPYGSITAGFKAVFLKGNLVLTISGNDLLRSERPMMMTYSNGIRQQYINYYDNRNVKISMVYKMGNRNLRVNRRNAGNSEERERTGK